MPSPRGWWVLLVAAATGCAGDRPAPGRPGPVTAEPTVLTPAQKERDDALARRIRPLLELHQNFGAVLSPDGTRVLFRSDRGGVPELFLAEVAHPERPAARLVAGPERVASALFTPDGRWILFRRDRGADENFHIYRIGLDGSGLTDLTPGAPLWRDTPLVAAGRLIFSARKPSDYASKILVQPLAPAEAEVVYSDPAPGTAVDVSRDGTHALWVREAASGGHELLEVDLASGQARMIVPRDGRPADVRAAAYSADGARILVATDGGGERHALWAIERATLARAAEYRPEAPAHSEVSAVVPSPRGDRIAIRVDSGNRSQVRLLDAASLAPLTDVATPPGSVSLGIATEVRYPLAAGTFTADGRRLVVGLSVPQQPDDIALIDAATGAVTPLRRESRPGLDRLAALAASIVEVPAFDGRPIPVNLYLPARTARAARLPVIVSFHGGPDASSSLEWNAWTRVFTAAGYAVAEPNIRGSTGFGRAWARGDDREKRVDALRDVESVNRWLRRQPWCDPDRLVLYGASYGGYVVLMGLTRQPSLWRAGVDLAGISDLMPLLTSAAAPARYLEEFGDPAVDAALIRAFSPIHQVDRIAAPLFIYQGQNDGRVPRAQADAIVRALRRRRVPVEYMVAGDEGHTVARRTNEVEFLSRVLRFLDDELGAAR